MPGMPAQEMRATQCWMPAFVRITHESNYPIGMRHYNRTEVLRVPSVDSLVSFFLADTTTLMFGFV
jgi:hypothetical protein